MSNVNFKNLAGLEGLKKHASTKPVWLEGDDKPAHERNIQLLSLPFMARASFINSGVSMAIFSTLTANSVFEVLTKVFLITIINSKELWLGDAARQKRNSQNLHKLKSWT